MVRSKRNYSIGWDQSELASLDDGDSLVTQLRAELEALDLSDVRSPRTDIPSGLHQPLYAVPVVVRHDLAAFALSPYLPVRSTTTSKRRRFAVSLPS
jgi:hypothetical protein